MEGVSVPCNVRGKVDLRLEFVKRVIVGGEPISRLCEEHGISRPTGYLWLRRYQETRKIQSLGDRSHRPKSSPNKTDELIEAKVIERRDEYGWGADKIQILLVREGFELTRIIINRIIKRNGLVIDEDCSKPAVKRNEGERPNMMWQDDLKGCMGKGPPRCEPLSILDDHSRFSAGLFPTRTSKLPPIRAAFQETFENYGIPDTLRMDHGVRWWGNAQVNGLSRLSVWLMKQDIRLTFSGYNHPQTQGKVERFHKTLAGSVWHKGTPTRFENWSPLLATIRHEYNHIRPHESLGMDVPASRYLSSNRRYNPAPKPPEYPSQSTVIKVDHLGRFRYRGLRLFASEALADELIRIEELESTAVIFYRNAPIGYCHRAEEGYAVASA